MQERRHKALTQLPQVAGAGVGTPVGNKDAEAETGAKEAEAEAAPKIMATPTRGPRATVVVMGLATPELSKRE
ncbi:hypothetical protein PCANC_09321 [Puccinia coronata f. sp. avenae]|uniref:Uncharacterized protein n=1 Tax=Puccinia coronata f. sp. avenae TaxID=200324 RepID=A0A2N5T5J3_9BASI|nr:hypothetical protein PCANC_09321 [Puccinia coronata f. sp. avenae]